MQYKLIMGNQAYSSWSLRGWLLLRAFGLEFEHEVVRLYLPDYENFLDQYYPASTVPTLQVSEGDEPFLIWDSFAIAEYLHERHPGIGIWPAETNARAAARSLCAEMHSSYTALRSTMPMNVRREYRKFTPDSEALQDIERIEQLWAWARQNWGGKGPYLFGEHFCAVDAFYAPVASRFQTYGIALQHASKQYVEVLLRHPATQEFYAAGRLESWIMEQNEYDLD